MGAPNWSREELIARRAYYKWLATGRPAEANWFEAEKEIDIEETTQKLAWEAAVKFKGVGVAMRPGRWDGGYYIPTVNLYGTPEYESPWYLIMQAVSDAVAIEVGYEISRDPPP